MTKRTFCLSLALVSTLLSLLAAAIQSSAPAQMVLEHTLKIRRTPASTEPTLAATPSPCVLRRTLRVVNVEPQDVLNLRASPSAVAPILYTIPPYAHGVVDLAMPHGAWIRARHAGISGYVDRRYVAPDTITCVPVNLAQSAGD